LLHLGGVTVTPWSAVPIDVEPLTGVDEPPPVRRRRLAAPPGILLALCMFAPLLRVCGDPVYPVEAPFAWTPYLLGVIVAALAYAQSRRVIKGLVVAAQVILALTALVPGYLAMFTAGKEGFLGGSITLGVGAALVLALAHGSPSVRAANTLIVTGALCTAWFSLFVFSDDAMWGAYLSLATSLAILLLGIEWRRVLAQRRPLWIPAARVLR
jgi:hypothetical protein